jgi:hypothetical protein
MVSYGTLRKNGSVFHLDVRRLTDSCLERFNAPRTILWMDAVEKPVER